MGPIRGARYHRCGGAAGAPADLCERCRRWVADTYGDFDDDAAYVVYDHPWESSEEYAGHGAVANPLDATAAAVAAEMMMVESTMDDTTPAPPQTQAMGGRTEGEDGEGIDVTGMMVVGCASDRLRAPVPPLRQGDAGPRVMHLHYVLHKVGYLSVGGAWFTPGVFCAGTRDAVWRLQSEHWNTTAGGGGGGTMLGGAGASGGATATAAVAAAASSVVAVAGGGGAGIGMIGGGDDDDDADGDPPPPLQPAGSSSSAAAAVVGIGNGVGATIGSGLVGASNAAVMATATVMRATLTAAAGSGSAGGSAAGNGSGSLIGPTGVYDGVTRQVLLALVDQMEEEMRGVGGSVRCSAVSGAEEPTMRMALAA